MESVIKKFWHCYTLNAQESTYFQAAICFKILNHLLLQLQCPLPLFFLSLDVYLSLDLYMVQITLHKLHTAELKKAILLNPFLSDRFCISAHTLTVITEHVPHLKSSFWNKHDRSTYNIFNEILL